MDEQRAPQDRADFLSDVVDWLAGPDPLSVVTVAHPELGSAFAGAGHRVTTVASRASTLRFPRQSLDLVVASDLLPADLESVADQLRPGGRLALTVRRRDHRIPWARKLDRALGVTPAADLELGLITSPRFGFVETQTFRYWQVVNHESLAALLTRELEHLDEADRQARVAAALDLYADYGRGIDGMQLPWVTTCFKAGVVDQVWATPQEAADARDAGAPDQPVAQAAPIEPPDDAMLLIDFR